MSLEFSTSDRGWRRLSCVNKTSTSGTVCVSGQVFKYTSLRHFKSLVCNTVVMIEIRENGKQTCRKPSGIGSAKCLFSFFCKRKDISFHFFTNSFTDLDILSMSSISHYWLLQGRGQGAAKHLPMPKTAPQQRIIWPKCR